MRLNALLSSRRCIIPADGFYEWKQEGKMQAAYAYPQERRWHFLAGWSVRYLGRSGG
ncbi:SOS response-associated peptidase family protein [Paenibacillus apii]|uniref:SOS response-associated peptidase family protein n=1 Tax=Paenibacillus apii TaxID=1850370 RepID=UPI002E2B3C39|nr:SOS response-associated peptidase family protein [Paenibacillus apii]